MNSMRVLQGTPKKRYPSKQLLIKFKSIVSKICCLKDSKEFMSTFLLGHPVEIVYLNSKHDFDPDRSLTTEIDEVKE